MLPQRWRNSQYYVLRVSNVHWQVQQDQFSDDWPIWFEDQLRQPKGRRTRVPLSDHHGCRLKTAARTIPKEDRVTVRVNPNRSRQEYRQRARQLPDWLPKTHG